MAFEFIPYMRSIAQNLRYINNQGDEKQKRFYRVSGLTNMEEVLNNLTDSKMFPAILANDLEVGRIGDMQTSDNYLEKQTHIFYVVGYANLNAFDEKEACISELKKIMYKIIGKMRKDYRDDYRGKTETGMRNLDTTSFFYQVITGFGPHCHGIMVTFEVSPNIESNLQYDETDWV